MSGVFKLVTTIVDKGLGEDVMNAAAAVVKGGTIIDARGYRYKCGGNPV